MKKGPTIEECLATVREINKDDVGISEEALRHKANWLYLINRLSFWEDMPVLVDLIQHEIKLKTKE